MNHANNVELSRLSARTKLMPFWYNYFLAFTLAFFSASSLALENDRKQPIQIEANAATFNEKSGKSTYNGDVKVTQGSIRLWADELIVFSNNGVMEKMVATGKLVKFRQTPDSKKEDIQGSALRIEYYGEKSLLIMLKKARLWQGKNTTTSERIEYDSQNSIIKAGKKTSGSQRVRVILQPKQNKK